MEWRNTDSLPPEERANSEFLMLSLCIIAMVIFSALWKGSGETGRKAGDSPPFTHFFVFVTEVPLLTYGYMLCCTYGWSSTGHIITGHTQHQGT